MRSTLDPSLDVVFKLLLGSPEGRGSLIALLTAILKPKAPIVSVEVLNPELPRAHVTDRGVILDLHVGLADGTRIDVEMQVDKRDGFRQRILYYWARDYGGQLERGEGFEALKPVVAVIFLDYVELDGDRWHSEFRLREVEDHTPFSDALVLHVLELPKRNSGVPGARQEDAELLAWMRFLGAKDDEEVKEACMSSQEVAKANELLTQLSASPRAQELARERKEALAFYRMELASTRNRAIAEGEAKGKAEGEAKGEAKGRVEGQRKVLLHVLEQRFGVLSIEARGRVLEAREEEIEHLVDGALGASSLEEAISRTKR